MNEIGFKPPLPSREIRQLSEGEMPYNLSRLEYLELFLNSYYSWEYSLVDMSINLYFLAHPAENKIVIHINHKPDANQTFIEMVLKQAYMMVNSFIETRNWDWVKIEHKISEYN